MGTSDVLCRSKIIPSHTDNFSGFHRDSNALLTKKFDLFLDMFASHAPAAAKPSNTVVSSNDSMTGHSGGKWVIPQSVTDSPW